MKVKELLEKLKDVDKELEVVFEAYDIYDCPIWADANFLTVMYDDVSQNKVVLIKENNEFDI